MSTRKISRHFSVKILCAILKRNIKHFFRIDIQFYFFICARLELFCDFLQFDWLHERAAFYDILARGPKELFF